MTWFFETETSFWMFMEVSRTRNELKALQLGCADHLTKFSRKPTKDCSRPSLELIREIFSRSDLFSENLQKVVPTI